MIGFRAKISKIWIDQVALNNQQLLLLLLPSQHTFVECQLCPRYWEDKNNNDSK